MEWNLQNGFLKLFQDLLTKSLRKTTSTISLSFFPHSQSAAFFAISFHLKITFLSFCFRPALFKPRTRGSSVARALAPTVVFSRIVIVSSVCVSVGTLQCLKLFNELLKWNTIKSGENLNFHISLLRLHVGTFSALNVASQPSGHFFYSRIGPCTHLFCWG